VKIYTKSGDEGATGLLGPGRVSKSCLRIEAYGTVDEVNAALGAARAEALDGWLDTLLEGIQADLFVVGASLADPSPAGRFHDLVSEERVGKLEAAIDAMEAELEPLTQFILPGGCAGAARLHQARTICRRAERCVTRLMEEPRETVAPRVLAYLNRLSDLLFVAARRANRVAGVADVAWEGM
jgi:cob(I)alamin adenosyltransferase